MLQVVSTVFSLQNALLMQTYNRQWHLFEGSGHIAQHTYTCTENGRTRYMSCVWNSASFLDEPEHQQSLERPVSGNEEKENLLGQ